MRPGGDVTRGMPSPDVRPPRGRHGPRAERESGALAGIDRRESFQTINLMPAGIPGPATGNMEHGTSMRVLLGIPVVRVHGMGISAPDWDTGTGTRHPPRFVRGAAARARIARAGLSPLQWRLSRDRLGNR